MSDKFSFTISPPPAGGGLLSVEDVMGQALDIIRALQGCPVAGSGTKIVWRLQEAHTNSPPLTIIAEAFHEEESEVISPHAGNKQVSIFIEDMKRLAEGEQPRLGYDFISPSLRSLLRRSTESIHTTIFEFGNNDRWKLTTSKARASLSIIQAMDAAEVVQSEDLERTEYGDVEGVIKGLTTYYGQPALVLKERLSGIEIKVILSDRLAEDAGQNHKWSEAWSGQRVSILGELSYNSNGSLIRAKALDLAKVEARPVPLSELRKVNLVQNKTISEHINKLRNE